MSTPAREILSLRHREFMPDAEHIRFAALRPLICTCLLFSEALSRYCLERRLPTQHILANLISISCTTQCFTRTDRMSLQMQFASGLLPAGLFLNLLRFAEFKSWLTASSRRSSSAQITSALALSSPARSISTILSALLFASYTPALLKNTWP